MFGAISAFVQSIMAPRLYRIYHRASSNTLEQLYEGNFVESIGDFGISYLIPSGVIYCVWQRRWQYFLYLGMFIVTTYVIRAAGRAVSPSYQNFIQILYRAQKNYNSENAELLRRYDFEFKSWPVSFKSKKTSSVTPPTSSRDVRGTEATTICWAVGWLVAHTFGVRLVYPGLLLSRLLKTPIDEGRAKLVVELGGIRSKVETADGNGIDTIFFDRRRLMNFSSFTAVNEVNQKGKTLVINFEGNAGFYEIGMGSTPLECGYSVLGFNHPGFAGSSGTPYPAQELNAAEAVFDYATTVLGFKEEEIVLSAWSIGGFPAAHLASSHPKIKALMLDATFDDVLVLALPRMPMILSSIVRSTIRNHLNLRISRELEGYGGPIRLIRRTDDEIIADPPGVLPSNRGNYLLVDIIRQRYPELLENLTAETALFVWLEKPHLVDPALPDNQELKIPSNMDTLTTEQKLDLVIKIAAKLMTDFKSTHCTPLPPSYFQMPWNGSGSIHPDPSQHRNPTSNTEGIGNL